jgi:short-subunit dehydrogenase
VLALCPGFTKTEFHDRMGEPRGTSILWMEPEPLVARALSDFDKGRRFSIPGAQYRAIVALTKVIPSRALQGYQSIGRK